MEAVSFISFCERIELSMKNFMIHVVLFAAGMSFLAAAAPAATIDFSDITLAPNSYNDGRPSPNPPEGTYDGTFTSGGVSFNNSVTIGNGFSYYNGWATSNRTLATPAPNTYPEGNYDPAYQFSVANGGTGNYGIAYLTGFDPALVLPVGTTPVSMQVNNSNYAILSMRDGDFAAKKFGGPLGTDEDFFLLTITGLNNANVQVGSPVSFYLGNFLGSNTTIVDTWQTIDLSSLAGSTKLSFGLTSSDNGQFGMNTPAFFAMDNLVVTAIPEPTTYVGLFLVACGACYWKRRSRLSV